MSTTMATIAGTSFTGEEDLVQTILAPLAAGYPNAFGLKDDCATISLPPGLDLVVKTDPIAAGVHFFADDDPADIGWKSLAVNVSDLAAKGATPLGYVMALSFPVTPERAWMERFAAGLGEAQSAFGMHLMGGDTDKRPGPVSIAVTAFGTVAAGRMIRRGSARPGDKIYVTGTIGDAYLGLGLRSGKPASAMAKLAAMDKQYLLDRYLRPEPRLAFRAALNAHASAAMDISDGLVKDLERMCRTSRVGAELWLGETPLSGPAVQLVRAEPGLLTTLASAGDDYELLIAVPAAASADFEREARSAGRLTCIGEMTAGCGLAVHDVDGRLMTFERAG